MREFLQQLLKTWQTRGYRGELSLYEYHCFRISTISEARNLKRRQPGIHETIIVVRSIRSKDREGIEHEITGAKLSKFAKEILLRHIFEGEEIFNITLK